MTNSASYGGSGERFAHLHVISDPDFSVLRDHSIRPLPVALAHRIANAKAGDPYLEIFHRLYESLAAPDRTRCLLEIAEHTRLLLGAT